MNGTKAGRAGTKWLINFEETILPWNPQVYLPKVDPMWWNKKGLPIFLTPRPYFFNLPYFFNPQNLFCWPWESLFLEPPTILFFQPPKPIFLTPGLFFLTPRPFFSPPDHFFLTPNPFSLTLGGLAVATTFLPASLVAVSWPWGFLVAFCPGPCVVASLLFSILRDSSLLLTGEKNNNNQQQQQQQQEQERQQQQQNTSVKNPGAPSPQPPSSF